MKQFVILDEREIWHAPACEAARVFGYEAKRIYTGTQMPVGALGFIRTHADKLALAKNQDDYKVMSSRGIVIQDRAQVEVYENKTEQFNRWGRWMPATWVFTDQEAAMRASFDLPYPIVSKANEGASSVNVRIYNTHAELQKHIHDVFAGRVMVNSCSGVNGRTKFPQSGYVLLQEFIPHTITWRVNAIGDHRALFKRYCYKHKQVAQTGNVEPVLQLGNFELCILDFANDIFKDLDTKWCAIDILHDECRDRLVLLETSLAWPWPSPGACMHAPLFKPDGTWERAWSEMWYSMFEQVAEGVWARPE
jgi:hypothetical protein